MRQLEPSAATSPLDRSSTDTLDARLAATVARWADAGLITSDQATMIVDFERDRSGELSLAGRETPPAASPARRRRDIDVGSVVMYFGAFLILFALTIFIGASWDDMGRGAQFGWALAAVASLGASGIWLRRGMQAITGGNLLVFVAVGVVPLLVYTFQRLVGWWPDEPALAYADYYRRINGAWVAMEVVSVAVALIATVRLRFPLMMLLVGVWGWFLALDLARLLLGDEKWAWDDRYLWLSGAIGLAMAGVAVLLYRRGLDDYGVWLAIFGNFIWLVQLGTLALGGESAGARVIYPLVGLAAVVASAWLQARVYLVFGALALYAWVSYLVFDLLGTGLGVTVGLVLIGLLVLLSGVLYQRSVEPWLEKRFGHAPGAGAIETSE